jgi:hypothetical protein
VTTDAGTDAPSMFAGTRHAVGAVWDLEAETVPFSLRAGQQRAARVHGGFTTSVPGRPDRR